MCYRYSPLHARTRSLRRNLRTLKLPEPIIVVEGNFVLYGHGRVTVRALFKFYSTDSHGHWYGTTDSKPGRVAAFLQPRRRAAACVPPPRQHIRRSSKTERCWPSHAPAARKLGRPRPGHSTRLRRPRLALRTPRTATAVAVHATTMRRAPLPWTRELERERERTSGMARVKKL